MAHSGGNRFKPDYAIHPGEIIEETLQARGIKQSDFAKWCSLSEKTVSQIINKKAPVSPETAIQFERVLGIAAHIWNNLDSFYNLHLAQQKSRKNLEKTISWAQQFPVKKLADWNFISKPDDKVDAVEQLLNFFGVGSVHAWEEHYGSQGAYFHHSPSFKSKPECIATWLRMGEILAEEITTEKYNRKKFKDSLERIRPLTKEPPEVFEPEAKELCRKAGVALVFIYELPGIHLSGATRWLNKDKALIMLSLRHRSDDHLWFSFFHESAHILRHGKKEVFLDEEKTTSNVKEEEANSFAANFLIPEAKYKILAKRINNSQVSRRMIRSFAEHIGIAPGVVVGRLQHDGVIPYGWLNDLKNKFKLPEYSR